MPIVIPRRALVAQRGGLRNGADLGTLGLAALASLANACAAAADALLRQLAHVVPQAISIHQPATPC